MKINTSFLFVLVLSSLLSGMAYSQKSFVLDSNPKLTVSGTSTLHDWVMESTEATGYGDFYIEQEKVTGVENLKVVMAVKSLKSGKNAMDNNTYKALNEKEHPQITFQVTEVTPSDGNYLVVRGRLTVSGETRTIKSQVKTTVSGNTIHATGQFPIQFTEFDLDPPTALLGTIKTGDELTISYDLSFRLKS